MPREEFCEESCGDVASEPLVINNGVLFEKDNLLLPAAFFEKKKNNNNNNHEQGRLAGIQFVSFILRN